MRRSTGLNQPRGNAPQSKKLSAGTQSLLKGMMKQSGLTASQQRRLLASTQAGGPLPERCHPTSSAQNKPAKVPTRPKKVLSNGQINVRAYTGGKRSKKDIAHVTRPTFVPDSRTVDRDTLKDNYCDTLVYGARGAAKRQELKQAAKRGDLQSRTHRIRSSDEEHGEFLQGQQEFDQLMSEIDERHEHLQRMQNLGVFSPTEEATVRRDISVRVRRLEQIDAEEKAKLAACSS